MEATADHKILHLVRHAQGIHNVERNRDALLSSQLLDAHLSPLGLNQVEELRHQVRAHGIQKRIQLVITSPLTRTMQTAVGVFGGEEHVDGSEEPPLMVENVGNSNNRAVSSLHCPPFLAVELCRERLVARRGGESLHLVTKHPETQFCSISLWVLLASKNHHCVSSSSGVHPCDKRRSVKEYQSLFPAIDFSLIESDGDSLWNADVTETNEELAARGLKFINWLWTREEKEIAVVTHSGFLLHTLNAYRNDCDPSVRNQICRIFKNCELLSVVIFDRSMLGSDSLKTNYAIDLLKE